jgi:hypothetical protein
MSETDRDRLIHTIGNLTLLPRRLNSTVSNGPWSGEDGKRAALMAHDVLFLNRDLRAIRGKWTDDTIRQRTRELANIIIKIWPVPPGYKSTFAPEKAPARRHRVTLADLLSAGLLAVGSPLFPRRKKFQSRVATLLADGHVEVDGTIYTSPSDAADAITGHSTNGWGFFLVDQASKRTLRAVRREYIEGLAVDADDEDVDDDGHDDER